MGKFRKRRLNKRRAVLDKRVALRRVKINRQNRKIDVFFRFFSGDGVLKRKMEKMGKIRFGARRRKETRRSVSTRLPKTRR